MKTLILAAALLASGAAQAAPIQWTTGSGANNHWYEFIGTGESWTNANAAATASTYFDGSNTLGGYLATITSSDENAFIGTLANDGWIGASDAGHEGDWRWVGGPEAGTTFWLGGVTVTYSSWNGGEPNNSGGEDYAHYQGGNWNDLPDYAARGYFVEYNEAPAEDVPEPGMIGLLGLGIASIAFARRKR